MNVDIVRKILTDVLETNKVENVDIDYDLTSLGLDSLNYMKLIVLLEDHCNISIPIEKINFSNFISISAICKLIKEINNK